MPARFAILGSSPPQYEQELAIRGSEPAFDDDGVDQTLARVALDRTPVERVHHDEAAADSVLDDRSGRAAATVMRQTLSRYLGFRCCADAGAAP